MTFGNNYQPSSASPVLFSLPPSRLTLIHPWVPPLLHSPPHPTASFPLRRAGEKWVVDWWEAGCCCRSRLWCDLNFQIRLICWKWDWPVAFSSGRLRTMSHVLFHVIPEPVASESYRLRSLQCRQLRGIWATCHPVGTHTFTHVLPPILQKSNRACACMDDPSSPFTTPVFPFSTGIWNGWVLLLGLLSFQMRQRKKKAARTSFWFGLNLQSSQKKRKGSFMSYCN